MEEDRNPRVLDLERRLTWYPRLLLGALALALLLVVVGGDGPVTISGRIGGDYPAFHGAGRIVLQGDVDGLYDPDVQSKAQADLFAAGSGFLPFAYPPHVAVGYAPLAALPYRLGYMVHTALMAVAVLVAVQLIRPMAQIVDRHYWVVAAAALSAWPLFRAVGAGQNTALTLLLIAAIWRALEDDREILVGIAAGLLLFRPQYGIPISGLLLMAGHRRAVGTAAAVAGTTWIANSAIVGPDWFSDWFREVGPFIEADAVVNARNSISWIGFSEAIVGPDSPIGFVVGGTFAIATVAALVWMWRLPERFPLDTRMAAAAGGLVLMSPHTMFYDAGLLLVPAVVAVERGWLGVRGAALIWALGFVHLAAAPLGATPLAIVVMTGFGWTMLRAVDESGEAVREPAGVTA